MILQAPPGAPIWMQAGAAALLVAHIGGGSVGMASGAVALLAPKGGWIHRKAGDVFFAAMLAMTGVAVCVSPVLSEHQWTNTVAAAFTLYLVATGWATVMRRPGATGRFEIVAMVWALGIVAAAILMAVTGAGATDGPDNGVVYLFAGLAALAAICDLMVIRRGGIVGVGRIARHLWRMCLALAVALGSFFLGQQKFLPEAWRGSAWLNLPVFSALGLMAFWLIRVRIGRAFKAGPVAPPTLRRPAPAT